MDRIYELFCRLDSLVLSFTEPQLGRRQDWSPATPEGREVFQELVSPHNRRALRKWYQRFTGVELNPSAANIKASLEAAIGEHL